MRWTSFAILVYLVTVLQTAVAPFLAVHGVRPDFLLIVAVHYALAASAHDALLACWVIGFVMDLMSLPYQNAANVGAGALALSLVALAIVRLRALTFRDSVVTQLFFTFTAKLGLALLVGLHMVYVLDLWSRWGEIVLTAFYAAVYTALLGPYGHWLLTRLRGPLGIGSLHRLRLG